MPFREERRDEGRPGPAYAPAPTPPYDVILEFRPEYYYFYIRLDLSKATHCWRPPATVFNYLSAVGVSIEWDYSVFWKRLVNEDLRLEDVIPPEHEVRIKVLRRLVGSPDNATFRLSEPLMLRAELGQRPATTQLSFDATVAASAD